MLYRPTKKNMQSLPKTAGVNTITCAQCNVLFTKTYTFKRHLGKQVTCQSHTNAQILGFLRKAKQKEVGAFIGCSNCYVQLAEEGRWLIGKCFACSNEEREIGGIEAADAEESVEEAAESKESDEEAPDAKESGEGAADAKESGEKLLTPKKAAKEAAAGAKENGEEPPEGSSVEVNEKASPARVHTSKFRGCIFFVFSLTDKHLPLIILFF